MEQLLHAASIPLFILTVATIVGLIGWNSYQVLRHGHLPQEGSDRTAKVKNRHVMLRVAAVGLTGAAALALYMLTS